MKAPRSLIILLFLMSTVLAGEWHVENVDLSVPDSGNDTSLDLTSNDIPYIAYFNSDRLLLAYKEGGEWNIETVDDEGPFTYYVSLALDSQDRPHIAYFQWHPARNLKYASWTGTEWHIEQVDDGAGTYCSLALDSSDRPCIAYCDLDKHLIYARWDGDEWLYDYIDTGEDECTHVSHALDSDYHPHISYKEGIEDDLKYVYREGSEWLIETVDTQENAGNYSSIAMDSQDQPHIGYHYIAGGYAWARHAYRSNSQWFIDTVDNDAMMQCMGHISLALDSKDRPYISSYAFNGCFDSPRCSYFNGERWLSDYVDWYSIAYSTSNAVDSIDQPHISYIGYCLEPISISLKYAWYETYFHLLSPEKGDTIYAFPFTFDWGDHDLDGFDSYTLWWSTDPDFNTYNEIKDLHESEYTLIGGIEDGARVYWRVKSLDDQGGEYWAEELDWYFDVDLGGGVDIVDFGAGATDEGVLVNWRLESEEPAGVRVLRSSDEDEPVYVSGGLPGLAERWLDTEVESGVQYSYWLEVVEADGTVSRFGPTEAVTVPGETTELALYAAYPSPSQEVVNFSFSIPADGRVVLSVYDLSGRRVATLVEGDLTAGRHEVSWNCAEIPSGVYLYRLETNVGSLTRRLVVSR